MFREMRRIKQLLPEEESIEILEKGTEGILAVNGDDGYPYTVPVNYIYKDGKISFHGATSGHKYDAMLRDPKVSFCVIAENTIDAENLTTLFKSVICFGKARLLKGDEMFRAAFDLGMKFYPHEDAVNAEIARYNESNMACFEIEIEHMTGKEGIELTRMRKSK